MNGTGNLLIDEPTIYIAVIYIRYILEQSVRVDGLEYFVKHPRTGGMCRVGGCADGSPQLPPLQVYKCVCVWVCLINNAGHSFGVLETVSNATWMFIFELLRFGFEFWLNALAVQFLLKFIWENENNNTIIISKRKQSTAGGSRKSCGRGREEGEEKQTNLSCDILLDFSFI